MEHADGVEELNERRRVESKQAGSSGQALVGKYVPPAARNRVKASDTMGASGVPNMTSRSWLLAVVLIMYGRGPS